MFFAPTLDRRHSEYVAPIGHRRRAAVLGGLMFEPAAPWPAGSFADAAPGRDPRGHM